MVANRSRGMGWLLPLLLVVAIVAQNFLSVRILQELATMREQMAGLMKTVVSASAPGGARVPGSLAPGTAAPAFAFPDTSGAERALAEFAGRKVLLVFSSPTCRFCAEFYPVLKTFAEEPGSELVEVLVLQIHSTPEQNRSLREERDLPFEILAASAEVFMAYQVPGTPFSVLVDESGRVAKAGTINTIEQLNHFTGS
jgi:methylamine dehydrogenase accessory protein MauD